LSVEAFRLAGARCLALQFFWTTVKRLGHNAWVKTTESEVWLVPCLFATREVLSTLTVAS